MDCNEAQEILSAYIDRELTDAETAQIAEHLRNCAACTEELAALQNIAHLMQQLPQLEPPADFRERLYRRLAVDMQQEKQNLWQSILDWARQKTYRGLTAAFASVLILFFSLNGIMAMRANNPLFNLVNNKSGIKSDSGPKIEDQNNADGLRALAPNATAKAPADTAGEKTETTGTGQPEGLTASGINGAAADRGYGAATGDEIVATPEVNPTLAPDAPTSAGEEPAGAANIDIAAEPEVPAENDYRMPQARVSLAGPAKPSLSAVTRGAKTVHRVKLMLDVSDLTETQEQVRAIAEQSGGSIGNVTYHFAKGNIEQGRQLTLQVPEGAFMPALERLEQLGEVTAKEVAEMNVTVQTFAAESRLSNIRRQQETLSQLRGSSADELQIVRLDSEIDYVQNEMAILQATLDSLTNAQVELILTKYGE